MNLKLLIYLIISFVFSSGYGQKIIVNKDIKVTETEILIKEKYPSNGRLYCYDIIKNDTITIYVSKVGLAGDTFKLIMVNGKVIPKVVKWTDTNSYDGKSSVELENANYKLEINDTIFKSGDTLKAKFTVATKKHRYSEKKKLTGEIFHIIGGNQYEWINGKAVHNWWWKNGKQDFTTQKSKED
ncbi:hypothetical protein [Flavobacterium suzhouense]|uniref:Uncharacterized protein n=1 Tax=Flavobacterium suzhouense TaxID=1529638 RepID=A0ABW5NWQ5_9FLAO